MQNKHPGFIIKSPSAARTGHPFTRTKPKLSNAPKPAFPPKGAVGRTTY